MTSQLTKYACYFNRLIGPFISMVTIQLHLFTIKSQWVHDWVCMVIFLEQKDGRWADLRTLLGDRCSHGIDILFDMACYQKTATIAMFICPCPGYCVQNYKLKCALMVDPFFKVEMVQIWFGGHLFLKRTLQTHQSRHKGLACKETVEQFTFDSLHYINQGEWNLFG